MLMGVASLIALVTVASLVEASSNVSWTPPLAGPPHSACRLFIHEYGHRSPYGYRGGSSSSTFHLEPSLVVDNGLTRTSRDASTTTTIATTMTKRPRSSFSHQDSSTAQSFTGGAARASFSSQGRPSSKATPTIRSTGTSRTHGTAASSSGKGKQEPTPKRIGKYTILPRDTTGLFPFEYAPPPHPDTFLPRKPVHIPGRCFRCSLCKAFKDPVRCQEGESNSLTTFVLDSDTC